MLFMQAKAGWLTQVPLKPPSVSVDAMTLWQGTAGAKGFLRMPCREAGGLSMRPGTCGGCGGEQHRRRTGLARHDRGTLCRAWMTVAGTATWCGRWLLHAWGLARCLRPVRPHLSNCTCGAVERCCKVAVCGHLALRDELAQLHRVPSSIDLS